MGHTIKFIRWILPFVLVSTAWGWGYDVHRRINQQAAMILEGEFGEFTKQHQHELALFAPIPDFIKETHREEFHRHFIDADLFEDFPFSSLSINFTELIDRFGEENVKKWGTGPWAIDDICSILTKMFKQNRWEEALYYMGHLGHYVADLHMPLHTCANYNGQFTGNEGVHFRWESRMVDELIPRFYPVGNIHTIDNYVDAALDITRDSFQVYPKILKADSLARQHLTQKQTDELKTYNALDFEDPYLQTLFSETEDIIYDRLGQATVLVASYWYTCWLAAGSPSPPD